MKRKKLVVIGNGMAGIKCVEEIYKLDPQQFHITVFGNEVHPNYNRILLSKVLQGDSSTNDIVLNDWSWYEEKGIRLYTGETVARIHVETQEVETASGIRTAYDSLIIATGSSAFIPPISGVRKPGVISFRNIDDCNTMMDYAKKYRKAIVIGGGLLGLEAARGLLNLGMETDVIHNAPYLMNRQLDRMSADLLRAELEQQGMRFWLNKETESIIGLNRAKGVRFTGGSTLEADLIVISVGIRPNILLAKTCGIETNRAIIVDDFMRTSIPNVYAVGECAEHRGTAYGLVAPLYEQGKVLARVLCGQDTDPYTGSVPYAQLKVSGVEVFSVGDIREGEADTAMQMYDGVRGTYKKVTMKGGTIRGAILFGDTAEGTSLLSLVKRKAPVSALSTPAGNSGSGGLDAAAADMPDRETVCACNAVSKGAIMRAVIEDGLQTPEQVRDCTKASSSCGGCRPMMEAVVRYALRNGKEGLSSAAPPVCGCTELNHEMLKASIAQKEFSDIHEAMLSLGWKKPLGCEICQSSIRYYLELFHPRLSNQEASFVKDGKYNSLSVGIKSSEDAAKDDEFNSRYLGETLRKVWEPLSLPYPVNAAITSGMNSPAGVLVHDIGITGAPAGWEIYAGGHAEHPVKQGQLIGIAETDAQAVELGVSCLQLYRERSCYGEAVWKWIEREGIVEIREMLFDLDFRQELVDRAGDAGMPIKNDERLGEGICGNC